MEPVSAEMRKEKWFDSHDFVFWMGDLNYRVDMVRSTVEQAVKDAQWNLLLANDQLLKQRDLNLAFEGFHEARIKFPPTFKYDIDSDIFDSSTKQRVPSWTDRILFRGPIDCIAYSSIPTVKISDHRPVIGVFTVSKESLALFAKHAFDSVDLATYDREAYIEGLRRSNEKIAKDRYILRTIICIYSLFFIFTFYFPTVVPPL